MFKLSKQNAKEFARLLGNPLVDAAYFGRAVSAMHRSASGKQQQAIIEAVQAAGMAHTMRELDNGAMVSAFD
jgi:hypothetical protein